MLPSINTQQRGELAYDWILVCICADQDLPRFIVFDEPGPAAALDTGERSIEFALEGGEVFVGRVNRCLLSTPSVSQKLFMILVKDCRGTNLQLSFGLPTTTFLARCQILPKQRMVNVPTTMKVDQRLQGNDALDILLGFGSG